MIGIFHDVKVTGGTLLLVAAVLIALSAPGAAAAQIDIVALGSSNTFGTNVARGQDYPAQLQTMLRAKGYDVRVTNAGINGDTTGGMLRRLEKAVPRGTNLVILQPGVNDRRKGLKEERAGNITVIQNKLTARGIKVILLQRVVTGLPKRFVQPDGDHLTAAGYHIIAHRVFADVVAAIGPAPRK